MKTCTTIITILLLMGISCSDKQNMPTDTEKIKKEVGQLLDKYVNDVNTSGLEKAASYFSDDKRFYWVEDGIIQYPDRAALLKGIAAFAPQVSAVHMQVTETKIDVIDPQHVLLFVQYKEDITLKSNYTVKLDGAMTICVEQKDNTWKFLSGHSSIKKPRGNT